MCGLAGFTGPGPDAREIVESMLAPIRYRGPDQKGVFVDDHIALGHLRLTIIDPDGGTQPLVDPETGDGLSFNGEIYDYRQHAQDLRRAGARLRDNSDTEVLFTMIQRHGVLGALDRLDGMFTFVFREGRTGRVYLARDRFGEKPLYYGVKNGALVFASELKSLCRHPAFARPSFDPVAIHQYLTFEYVPAPRSLFTHIRKLLPSQLVVFENGTITEIPYWRPRYCNAGQYGAEGRAPAAPEAASVDRLEQLLDRSVRARLVADVPVGVFLSGGIDSALVAMLAGRHAPGIKAYTVQMPDHSYDETPYAAEVCRRYGLTHRVARLSGSEFIRALDEIEGRLDEPLADSSIIPTYLLCRFAREEVTVALSGDGGDELFAGYPNFKLCRFLGAMARCPRALAGLVRAGLERFPSSGRYMSLDFVLRRLAVGLGVPADLQSYYWMAAFTDEEKRAFVSPEFAAAVAETDTFEPVLSRLAAAEDLSAPVERMLYLFTVLYLPDDILTKVDRASMFNSLEVRAPYLDRAFAEYAMSLPPRYKLRGFTTKYLLKRLAARHLPVSLVHRPKHGFAVPLADLLRGVLKDRVTEVLMDQGNPLADWFRRDAIATLLAEHASGRRDHRKKIWTLYSLFRFADAAYA